MAHLFEPVVRSRPKKLRGDDVSERDDADSAASDPSSDSSQGAGDGSPASEPHHDRLAEIGSPSRRRQSLKRSHVVVLNTIIQTCIRRGDFARAGRAFAMMLRLEVNSHHIDLRKNGLWGIGAELLTRLHEQQSAGDMLHHVYTKHGSDTHAKLPADSASREDIGVPPLRFEAVKPYYERLILQYPYRQFRPNEVSAMDFYPTFFALWIYHSSTQALNRTSGMEHAPKLRVDAAVTPLSSRLANARPQRAELGPDTPLLREQLSQAEQILQRLAQVIKTPPLDRSADLLKLLGSLNLWVYDLLVELKADPEDSSRYQEAAVRLLGHAQER